MIKRFKNYINENKLEQEIVDFCNSYLSYLIDNGFYVESYYSESEDLYHISIAHDNNFEYSEVVDEFIPFIKSLDLKYHILDYSDLEGKQINIYKSMLSGKSYGSNYVSVEDVLDDKIPHDILISWIELKVK